MQHVFAVVHYNKRPGRGIDLYESFVTNLDCFRMIIVVIILFDTNRGVFLI